MAVLNGFAEKFLKKTDVSNESENLKQETISLNDESKTNIKYLKLDEIETDPEISSLFSIKENTLELIKTSMHKNGYDKSQPVIIWKNDNKSIIVDGNTRVKAAREIGLDEIPVYFKEFEDRQEAIRYTYARQAERRNLTDNELLTAVKLLDKKQTRDGSGRSVEILGKELGVSPSTIVHTQTVLKKASDDDIEAIKDGKKSINKVYKEVKTSKPKNKVKNEAEKSESTIELPVFDYQPPNLDMDMETIPVKSEKNEATDVSIEDILRLLAENNENTAIDIIIKKYRNSVDNDVLLELDL
jgi:ParB family chromosome partitioning protein